MPLWKNIVVLFARWRAKSLLQRMADDALRANEWIGLEKKLLKRELRYGKNERSRASRS